MIAPALQVKREYVVFQLTRDLTHLNWWQRILWVAYFKFARWCYRCNIPTIVTEDGVRLELQAVCRDEAIANAIVAQIGPLAFTKPAPVDVTLPKSNVIFGGNRFPYSNAAKMYRENGKKEIATVCPLDGQVCRNHESLPRSEITKAYEAAKKLVT